MRFRRRKSRRQQLAQRLRDASSRLPSRDHPAAMLDVHQDSASLSFAGGLLLGLLVGIVVVLVLTLRSDSGTEPHVRQTGIKLLPRRREAESQAERPTATG